MSDKDIQLMYAPVAPDYELSLKKVLNDGNWKFYKLSFGLLKALPNVGSITSTPSITSYSSNYSFTLGSTTLYTHYFSDSGLSTVNSYILNHDSLPPISRICFSYYYSSSSTLRFYLKEPNAANICSIGIFPNSSNAAGNSFDFYFACNLNESPLEELTILNTYSQYFSNWKVQEVTYEEFVGVSGGGGVTPTGDPYILQLDQPTTQVSFYKDPALIPDNIKKDITIEGVTGTLEQGTASQDEYSLDLSSLDWTGGEYTEPSSKEGDKIVLLINYKLSNYDDPNGYLTVNSVTYKNADLPDRAKGVSFAQYLDRLTEQTITYSYTSGSGDVALRTGQYRYFGSTIVLTDESGTVTVKSSFGSYGILDLTYDVTESSEGPDPFD